MLRALKTLYGTATPAEALSSANVDLDTLELGGFLASLVANTAGAGIEAVRLSAPKILCMCMPMQWVLKTPSAMC